MKRSAHLTRILIEGMSGFSPYKGGRINYLREYDPTPMIAMDLVTKMDITRAIRILYNENELSKQELKMLSYVILDGRLSRREISAMIQEEDGTYVDQRTISRRLESAYQKISKFLGHEYSDERIFKMIAKKKGYPSPYILSAEEKQEVIQIWERI